MKQVYIISYDLSSPGQNYERVLKAIQNHTDWARLGGSSYIVISNDTVAQVRDSIMKEMDSNDQILVGVINAPAAWYGLGDEVSDWLKRHL